MNVIETSLAGVLILEPRIFRDDRGMFFETFNLAKMVEAARARGLRTLTDVNVVEVMVDLAAPGPLAVGMKVDVFFRADGR